LLALGIQLGEGTGAALAAGLVRTAAACHSGMATFDQARVWRDLRQPEALYAAS
jgi:nicotinate-nucleotide--dimethylbenzimidazole phosphoribosyltransferase